MNEITKKEYKWIDLVLIEEERKGRSSLKNSSDERGGGSSFILEQLNALLLKIV